MPRNPKERKQLFSELVNCKYEVGPHSVTIIPKEKSKRKYFPEQVLFAAGLLRNGLSYATLHHVPSRAIFDLEGNAICYLLTVTTAMNHWVNQEGGDEYGSTGYLKTHCGFGEQYIDWLQSQMDLVTNDQFRGNHLISEIKTWRFRRLRHPESRKIHAPSKARKSVYLPRHLLTR